MKIRTITCHDVYNYGASLQAYALQQYLETKGHDVKIIDYKPDYMRVHYKFWHVPPSSRYYTRAMRNPVLRFFLCCYFAPKRFNTIGRKWNFDKFRHNYLRLTRRYNSYDELQAAPPAADVYIAGSDQIWNCALPNGKDPAYFLQFGNKATQRISYAASFAISEIPTDHKAQMNNWLRCFDAISVREHTGLSILHSMGLEGTEVVDPVFLLKDNQWKTFAGSKPLINKKYLLVYDLYLNDARLQHEAERLSSEQGLKLVAVDANVKCPYAQINISDAGPQEFVNLISHAEYVLSNSFHATAFALMLNRPFAVFYKYANISRMADILHHVGADNSLNPSNPCYEFNWNEINRRIQAMRENSIQYLTEHL